MATARTYCRSALQKLGVLGEGQTMESGDAEVALETLNDLIDQMAGENLQIFDQAETTWTIVSGTGQYSVGSGGDVDVTRPEFVRRVNFRDTSTSPVIEFPLNDLTDQAWNLLTPKTLTNTYPSAFWYNPTYGANARATLELWPVPTSSTLTGVMYAGNAIAELSTLDTELNVPPGYRKYFKYQLAMDLAAAFGRDVTSDVAFQARETARQVKAKNTRMADLYIDRAALPQSRRRGWSIYTGP